MSILSQKYKDYQFINGDKPTVQAAPQWIPVSERLPEKDGEYLVTEYDDLKRINRIDITLWSDSQTICNGFYSARDITAWMPLPEPYKAESEEV